MMHEKIEADPDALEGVGMALRLALDEGHAEVMGDGMFILFQVDDEGRPHSVTVSRADLLLLLVE